MEEPSKEVIQATEDAVAKPEADAKEDAESQEIAGAGDAATNKKVQDKKRSMGEKLGLTYEEVIEKGYSLNRLKKLVVQQKYNDEKPERRAAQKEKKKSRKLENKLKGVTQSRTNFYTMKDSPNKTPVAISLSFMKYMNEKETRKLLKQVHRCYSLNRRSSSPCQFYLTSCTGAVREKLDAAQPGLSNWDVNFCEESYHEVFKEYKEKNNLVFLSSDSPNVLPEVDEFAKTNGQVAYVIGGLVDHNVYKGLTLGLATEGSIRHAKLPIDEYISLSSSKVLTVNHVFELMLSVSSGNSWPEAFTKVIPKRKMLQNKKNLTAATNDASSSGLSD